MPVDFSVVIPTYRRNRELIEAIASVCRQASVTVEIVVVDDCPEGGAQSVVDGLRDPRVRYLRNPKPSGGRPGAVRNLGWPDARGQFVHFLDDDDIVPAGHYAAVAEVFARRSDVGLVFGRVEPFGDCPEAQLHHERRFFGQAARTAAICERFGPRLAYVGQMLFDMPLLVCSAGVVRHECIAGVGGFDPDIRLMEDADFFVRVMRRFGTCYLDRPALRYRIGYPSLMHAPNPPPSQVQSQREGRRCMRAKYRREFGTCEFLALAMITRTVRMARRRFRDPRRDNPIDETGK